MKRNFLWVNVIKNRLLFSVNLMYLNSEKVQRKKNGYLIGIRAKGRGKEIFGD